MLAYFDIQVHGGDVKLDELGIDELRDAPRRAWSKRGTPRRRPASAPSSCDCSSATSCCAIVDQSWKDHLLALDHLKEGIGLRGYAQRDPKNEYKRESYELFTGDEGAHRGHHLEDALPARADLPGADGGAPSPARRRRRAPALPMESGPAAAAASGAPPSPFAPRQTGPPQPAKPQTVVRQGDKVGRNDPCPCGSGKKYKKCHGAASQVAT